MQQIRSHDYLSSSTPRKGVNLSTTLPVFAPAQEGEKRPLVLVVDASPTVRKVITATFRRAGGNAVAYSDPIQVLAEFVKDRLPLPDVAFIGLNLPKMSGDDLVRILRAHPHLQQTAFIVVTQPEESFACRAKVRLAGANALLEKPFTTQQLIDLAITHSPH